jgi:sulfite exporter TauE/SafE
MSALATIDLSYLFVLLGTGMVLGLKHAFDADHVAAVSTIVTRTDSLPKSLRYGAVWGGGHTATLLVVGLVVLLFKVTISDPVAAAFEGIVGLMLIVLGVNVFWSVLPMVGGASTEEHDPSHGHDHSEMPIVWRSMDWRSFVVGAVHGLAGSAALMLLVLSTVTSVLAGIVYILVFGVGSILGMLFFSGVLALPLFLSGDNARVQQGIEMLAGLASFLLGVLIVYEYLAH